MPINKFKSEHDERKPAFNGYTYLLTMTLNMNNRI